MSEKTETADNAPEGSDAPAEAEGSLLTDAKAPVEKSTEDTLYDNTGDDNKDAKEDTSKDDKPEDNQDEGEKGDEDTSKDDKPEDKDDKKDDKEDSFKDVALDDLDLPEGYEVDEALISEVLAITNEHNLPKEVANQLIPLGNKLAEHIATKQMEVFNETRTAWREEIANDKVIGGAESLSVAAKGLEAYGTPELSKLLSETGFGDNPEIIRVFHKIGLTVNEDTIVSGGSKPTGKGISAEDAIFTTMK